MKPKEKNNNKVLPLLIKSTTALTVAMPIVIINSYSCTTAVAVASKSGEFWSCSTWGIDLHGRDVPRGD